MKEKQGWLIRRADIDRYSGSILKGNRTAVRLMATTGTVLSAVNLVVQMVVSHFDMPVFRSALLLAYFTLLLFIDRVILPEDKPIPTGVLYIIQGPIMLISLLLGTVWDPDNIATTFLLFMTATPVFIMDHPNKSLGILAGWSALFLVVSWRVKDAEIFRTDAMDILEFFVAATAVTYAVVRIRLGSLQNLETAQYNMNHDRQTGCLNRNALDERIEGYLGKPLVALIGDIDQLTMYSDFYGKAVSDAIMQNFTRTLMKYYGEDATYTNGSDEILCLVQDAGMADCLEKAADCRKETHAFSHEGIRIALTFGLGCVSGQPETQEELSNIIQMAVVFAHKAKSIGRDQTWSGVYSPEAFRRAVAERNTAAHHAMPQEISKLTGLPRLSYFTVRTDEMLRNVLNPLSHPVIGHIKLTKLKEYNDEYGYAQGDQLISETAQKLREVFEGRHLCHITAGQFCVMCYRREVEERMDEVVRWLEETRKGYIVDLKAGFAEYTGTETASELIDKARFAQRSIISRNDTDYCFYDAELDEEQKFRQYIVNHVDEAIAGEWLRVYYQPIVRAKTGHVCGEEALSRWNDPKHGFLMPFRFIPPLEEQGLMYKVNLYVVERVLKDFAHKEKIGVPIAPVSVNLSRKDFLQCDMVEEITKRVAASGYSRDLIRIEITESAFIGDQDLLRREVRRFRENGFKVWMDDFGSEYSTLNLLQDIDFDMIKIDMRFTRNLMKGEKNYIIVSNVIRMAREMGITTLMEGIETEEQRDLLAGLGCDMLQGYLYSKPKSFEELEEQAKKGVGIPFEKPEEREGLTE